MQVPPGKVLLAQKVVKNKEEEATTASESRRKEQGRKEERDKGDVLAAIAPAAEPKWAGIVLLEPVLIELAVAMLLAVAKRDKWALPLCRRMKG